ncbi:MAG: ABC transporter permease [Lentisphaeria bacterium]|jgi:ABC-2 type transport system permease protein
MNRIRCILRKEIIQIRRDRRLLQILIVAPLAQLLVMGFAATTDVREVTLGVRDADHSFHSREFIRTLAAPGYFQATVLAGPEAADGERLVAGSSGLVVAIPAGFGRDLEAGRPATVQALVDGADSNFAVHGLNFLQRACRLYSLGLVNVTTSGLERRTGLRLPAVAVEARAWYNPDLTSTWYMVPSIMGVLLLVTTMIVSSMALVKEREEGTMEQIIVTPLRSGELIAGKLLPFAAIGFVEVTLALLVIHFVFHVPLRGSLPLLYLFSGLFLLTTLGLGLLISTLVRTQQQAMLFAVFFVMLPFTLLSGFIFPVANMPAAIRVVAELIPLNHYLVAVRGIFLKGSGWHELWPQAAALAASGAAILALAIAGFHKRLD